MQSWISSSDFCEVYDVNHGTLDLFVFHNKGSDLIKKDGRRNFIDQAGLIKIQENRKKTWLESHDFYFELQEDFKMRDVDQITEIVKTSRYTNASTWKTFLSSELFRSLEDIGILAIRSKSKYLYSYHKWAKEYLNELRNDISSFDSIDDYYAYHEALKLKNKMVA